MLFKGAWVSYHKEIVLGSRYRHIDSSLISKKTKAARFIAPHAIDDYDVFLTALICIHCIDLNISWNLRAPYFPQPGINCVFQYSHLCLVRWDNSYFAFQIAKASWTEGFIKVLEQHKCTFGFIDVSFGSLILGLLRVTQIQEVDSWKCLRGLHVLNQNWLLPTEDTWIITDLIIIEVLRSKIPNVGMHAVLDGEHINSETIINEPLKQRSTETSSLWVFWHSGSR